MNKALRHEKKMLKFKKRLKKMNLKETDLPKSSGFKSHGSPCSCWACRGVKYRNKRQKNKNNNTYEY